MKNRVRQNGLVLSGNRRRVSEKAIQAKLASIFHQRTKLLLKLLVTVIVMAVGLLLGGIGGAFFLGLLAASVTCLIDSRIAAGAGLICLASCPLLLVAEQQAWLQRSLIISYYAATVGLYSLAHAADEVAIWAFYLLSIGVVAQSIQYVKRARKRGDAG